MDPRRAIPLLLLTLAALVACAHAGGGPPAPVDGATLYRRSCASCHRLKAPAEHDAATWRRAVERFGVHLAPEERAAIAAYLAGAAG